MSQVIDLELWSKPLASAIRLDGKAVAKQCCAETSLTEDVVLGLSHLPDPIDSQNLITSIRSGELPIGVFNSFCQRHDLDCDASDNNIASLFLSYSFGQPLAWLHFPATAEGKNMAIEVLGWASANNYVITHGQGEPQLSHQEVLSLWPQT